MLTAVLFGVSVFGTFKLSPDFDQASINFPTFFLNYIYNSVFNNVQDLFVTDGSFLRDYLDSVKDYFPTGGMVGAIYMVDVKDVHTKMDEVED